MPSAVPDRFGIWRIGNLIHQSDFSVALAQPVDASKSGRWDYVIKHGAGRVCRLGMAQTIAVGASTNHPNLVPVLDGDPVAETPFVVMPRLEGETMRWHLEQGPPKPLPVVLWLTRQLLQGLQAMHEAGWQHADIKPANVMVGANGHVTIIDYAFASQGIASADKPFQGTPRYAAPEVLANASSVTPASDVFAAGRILWEWLTKAETTNDVFLSHVCELVEQMVDEVPQRRPPASDLVKALIRMEIDTLTEHVVPGTGRRAA